MNVRALLVGWWLCCGVITAFLGDVLDEPAAYVVAGVLMIGAGYVAVMKIGKGGDD